MFDTTKPHTVEEWRSRFLEISNLGRPIIRSQLKVDPDAFESYLAKKRERNLVID